MTNYTRQNYNYHHRRIHILSHLSIALLLLTTLPLDVQAQTETPSNTTDPTPISNTTWSSSSSSSSSSTGTNGNATLSSTASDNSNSTIFESSSSSSASFSPSSSSTGSASDSLPLWNASNYEGSQAVGVQNIPFHLVSSSAPWSARFAHTLIASASTLLLVGGIGWWDPSDTDPDHLIHDVWRSPDLGATWQLLTDDPPFGVRQGACGALVNQGILMIGGETLTGKKEAEVWSTSDLGDSWQLVSVGAFSSRAFHSCSTDITTGTLLVIGGVETGPANTSLGMDGGPDAERVRNDVYSTRDSGQTWELVSSNAPFPRRYGAACFWRNSIVYLLGGLGSDGEPLSDMWSSSDYGHSWDRVSQALPQGVAPRAFFDATSFAMAAYIVAGCNGGQCVRSDETDEVYGDVWRTIDGGLSWEWQASTSAFGPRAGAASVLSEGVWIMTGGVARGRAFNDVWATNLPQGNPNADGGIVAGTIGAAAGVVIVVLAMKRGVQYYKDRRAKNTMVLTGHGFRTVTQTGPGPAQTSYPDPHQSGMALHAQAPFTSARRLCLRVTLTKLVHPSAKVPSSWATMSHPRVARIKHK